MAVLIVDDEKNIRRTLRMVLEGEGWDVLDADRAEAALPMLVDSDVQLVLCDVRLPGQSGLWLLQQAKQQAESRDIPFLMISGHATVADAVEAVRLGATDFFEKPLDRDRVVVSVRNALARASLEKQVSVLQARVGVREEMLGNSQPMRQLFHEIEKIAPTKGRVLITGESGTGKELIARAVHRLSPRKNQAFVRVNCAAIPADLVESELFGHEKGAFTGAHQRKKGQFENAHLGTLFLDEIGDMPLPAQAKVLRALQQGEIVRVGSDQVQAVDVRVIAATNRDLEASVAAGTFREDLYFRLNVLPVRAPALRERREDLPLLITAFVRQFCEENGFRVKPIAPEVLEQLSRRAFPGNVRELKNIVERLVILSGEQVLLSDLPEESKLSRSLRHSEDARNDVSTESSKEALDDDEDIPLRDSTPGMSPVGSSDRPTLREFRDKAERDYIEQTLNDLDWNISRAATVLGIERTNLHKKMRSLGLRRGE